MQVHNVDFYKENNFFNNSSLNKVIDSEYDFESILTNKISITPYDQLIKELELEHNAKITFASDFYTSESMTGLNNVIIGKSTLEKMERNDAFRKKIIKIIDECCSSQAQLEVMGLSPPVKNAGLIIYPDGRYLCWLESIYSDDDQKVKDRSYKNNIDLLLENLNISSNHIMKKNISVEQFNQFIVLQDIRYNDKKRSK